MAPVSLVDLAAEAQTCTRCPLYRLATQTVFGEGPVSAPMMLVGEQPGDQEDLAGRPFVGPAGRVLDQALSQAGLSRAELYVTNAVKHFKHELRGKRRLHKTPDAGEVQACRWWLDREITVVGPKLIVALGATAAHALAGRPVVLSKSRGQILAFGIHRGLATLHPSAALRAPDPEGRRRMMETLAEDLGLARRLLQA